ncbi:MAG: hypothetical protein A2W25_15435 [candidate division Zixibacteria bacterium RBG_16_53_22]|nr:MAG: hypothetical protein A2W25_15435 [candidate division Zixibacteria bacterium RBG_16_53_22]
MTTDELAVLREYIRELFTAHAREHGLERDARIREQAHADDKFLKANAVREQIARERGEFVTADRFDALFDRIVKLEKAQENFNGRLIGAAAVMTLLFSVLQIILRFV